MESQKFGGPWTEKKLQALEKYLEAYLTIFTKNRRASKFTRHYVDAFAGSGLRKTNDPGGLTLDTEEGNDVLEASSFLDGSVRKVLSMDQAFHKYWFVEKDASYAINLETAIKTDFPDRQSQCKVFTGDANDWLPDWCDRLGPMDRAVVFLDPYGMEVKWTTIEKLATTRKVDLWMLFPSSAVIRMLPKSGPPIDSWSKRLTDLFGNEDWKRDFYLEEVAKDLLGEHKTITREVNAETVANYFLRRLSGVFSQVSNQPLILKNSRNSPLFMLVFAAGNPRGASLAVSIAKDIIDNV